MGVAVCEAVRVTARRTQNGRFEGTGILPVAAAAASPAVRVRFFEFETSVFV